MRIRRRIGLGYQSVEEILRDRWKYGDAGPQMVEVCGGPAGMPTPGCGVIQIPLPGGQTIGVTVTPTKPINAPLVSTGNGTMDRARTWLQEKSIMPEYENWKVAGVGLLAFMFLNRR